MKTMIGKILVSLGLASLGGLLLASCNSSSIGTFIQAAGTPGEVMIVMDGHEYESQAALELERALMQPGLAMPQEEPILRVTSRVAKAGFNNILRRARNIVIVDVDPARFSKASMRSTYNEWAEGQLVINITAPALDSVTSLVKAQGDLVAGLFVRHELFRQADHSSEAFSSRARVLVDSLFAHYIEVPRDITAYKVGQDFLWMSNRRIREEKNLVVYTFPYTSPRDLEPARLVAVRDSVLKANIPGDVEGSHPGTAPFGVYYRKVQMPDQAVRSEIRGLWEMKNGGAMGGPFVQQAYHDKEGGRVVVAEGFIYHPNEDKLNLVRSMEASLYSLRPKTMETFDPATVLKTTYSTTQFIKPLQ